MRTEALNLITLLFLAISCVPAPADVSGRGIDVLQEAVDAACERRASCGHFEPGLAAECSTAAMSALCYRSGGFCGAWVSVPLERWEACLAAVERLSCDELAAGALPGACVIDERLDARG